MFFFENGEWQFLTCQLRSHMKWLIWYFNNLWSSQEEWENAVCCPSAPSTLQCGDAYLIRALLLFLVNSPPTFTGSAKKADITEQERVHMFLHQRAREHGITRTRHARYTTHTHGGLFIRTLQTILLEHPVPVRLHQRRLHIFEHCLFQIRHQHTRHGLNQI